MFELPITIGLVIIGIALISEYMDSTLGMGYGTTLTPVLLLMGFTPLQIVPAVLCSELLTGLLSAAAHHRAGNVDFKMRPIVLSTTGGSGGRSAVLAISRAMPRHLKIALALASCSILGTVVAFIVAVNISKFYLNLYIGVMVLLVGLYILWKRRSPGQFSWSRLWGCGIIASFNKGLSGGGYGPIVTGGQVISGVESRNAVAITSLAEGLTCVVGFGLYFSSKYVEWKLFPYLCFGAILSVPLSAISVRKIRTEWLTLAIALLTIILGVLTLVKLFI